MMARVTTVVRALKIECDYEMGVIFFTAHRLLIKIKSKMIIFFISARGVNGQFQKI